MMLLVKRHGTADWGVMYAPRTELVGVYKEKIAKKLRLRGISMDQVRLRPTFKSNPEKSTCAFMSAADSLEAAVRKAIAEHEEHRWLDVPEVRRLQEASLTRELADFMEKLAVVKAAMDAGAELSKADGAEALRSAAATAESAAGVLQSRLRRIKDAGSSIGETWEALAEAKRALQPSLLASLCEDGSLKAKVPAEAVAAIAKSRACVRIVVHIAGDDSDKDDDDDDDDDDSEDSSVYASLDDNDDDDSD